MLHKYFYKEQEYGRTYLKRISINSLNEQRYVWPVNIRSTESIGCDYPLESIHLYYYAEDEFSLFSVIDRLECTIWSQTDRGSAKNPSLVEDRGNAEWNRIGSLFHFREKDASRISNPFLFSFVSWPRSIPLVTIRGNSLFLLSTWMLKELGGWSVRRDEKNISRIRS